MIKRIRVGLMGATGRMGKKVQELIVNDPIYSQKFILTYACSGPNDPRFPLIESSRPDVLLDFSAPASTLKMARVYGSLKIPTIVCTTGFTSQDLKKLEGYYSRGQRWAIAPNTSLGVFALREAVRAVVTVLPRDYSIEIVEAHHTQKKDNPSGTAKMLAAAIAELRPGTTVPIHSLRGGTEVGEHRVVILGPDERIELLHRAGDRTLFAHGALKLAAKLLSLRARRKPYAADELFAMKL